MTKSEFNLEKFLVEGERFIKYRLSVQPGHKSIQRDSIVSALAAAYNYQNVPVVTAEMMELLATRVGGTYDKSKKFDYKIVLNG